MAGSNVIQGYFLRNVSLEDLADRSRASLRRVEERIAELRADLLEQASKECQADWRRHRLRRAEEDLAAERARNYPFTDDEVEDALRLVYTGAPVDATAVTAALYPPPFEPSHSSRIRTGLALGRLARAGRAAIAQAPGRRTATRWVPMGGERDG